MSMCMYIFKFGSCQVCVDKLFKEKGFLTDSGVIEGNEDLKIYFGIWGEKYFHRTV